MLEDCEVSDIVCAHCLKKEDRQNYVAVQAVKASVIVTTVADPGPLVLGVLDKWTQRVNVLQTLIAQISFHIELCPIEARDSISLNTIP